MKCRSIPDIRRHTSHEKADQIVCKTNTLERAHPPSTLYDDEGANNVVLTRGQCSPTCKIVYHVHHVDRYYIYATRSPYAQSLTLLVDFHTVPIIVVQIIDFPFGSWGSFQISIIVPEFHHFPFNGSFPIFARLSTSPPFDAAQCTTFDHLLKPGVAPHFTSLTSSRSRHFVWRVWGIG